MGGVSQSVAEHEGTVQRVPARPRRGPASIEVLALLLVFGLAARPALAALFGEPAAQAWIARFVAVMVQAIPFLTLGIVLSSAIAVFVPAGFFHRFLPGRTALAVPVAGVSGAILPGCECASVPVAGALVRHGVAPAAALTFMLASPAINPIVVVSTFAAFPDRPEMVWARFVASLCAAVAIGWLWVRLGKTEWLRLPSHRHHDGGRWPAFWSAVRHDFFHAGGYLVVGAAIAATLNTLIPETWLTFIADRPVLGVLALAMLAVLVSMCSEADAFVAASLTQFSPVSQLAFMVVGPFVDVKLVAMHAATFGRSFAARFAPAAFAVAFGAAAVTGAVLL